MAGFTFGPAQAPIQPRVSQETLLVIIWVFYSVSIAVTSARLTLRVQDQKRLQPDDYLLLLACACLTAASAVLTWGLPSVYRVLALSIDPLRVGVPADLLGLVHEFQVILYVYIPLTWTAIYAAKFSYLYFFRQLVDRVRPLVLYWRAVAALTSVAGLLCVLQAFISCPYVDSQALTCAQGSMYTKSFSLSINSMTLDIVTDVLIVSIPACLLWRVRIKPAQKLGLAVFLCLSIVMAVMAIVRVSGLRITSAQGVPAFDTAWQYLWQQIEAGLAVCLVSLTAFRSLFIAHGRNRSGPTPHRSWYATSIERIKNRKKRSYEDDVGQLPEIPNGFLTGMRTFIQGGSTRKSTALTSLTTQANNNALLGEEEEWGLPEEQRRQKLKQQIRVTSGITHEVERGHARYESQALPLYESVDRSGHSSRSWLRMTSPEPRSLSPSPPLYSSR